jgi:D-beta-D-heptose 7-phosphate kinase/D-beta-D-heptose 1-phosphate adenosyltransferase
MFAGGYERIVFTNGCFDLIHPGHISVLQKSREMAGPSGAVVVGLNDDASVSKLKGPSRPILNEYARTLILLSMRFVDHVVLFSDDTPKTLIELLHPHVIVKGGDYRSNTIVGSDLALVVISDFDPAWSTTKIIEGIGRS